ncbi:MAG: VWA domain-containing protein [Candidatus Melainabacteria bacterium]|nr:VWA domain-containing protein [Candidatus Melainabacteria bacterium]
MHFLQEQAGLALPLALVGALIAWLAYAMQRQMIVAWGAADNASRYGVPIGKRRFVIRGILASLALAAGIVALMRPAIQSKHVEFHAGTVDVVVLLDVSRSMAARDCSGQSRLTCARHILREQISPSMQHNQIGVIAYAGKATPVVFLTEELETVNWLAEQELKISSAPGQGSAMGKAFELAFQYFDHDSDKSRRKMIVLLSDGGTDEETRLEEIVGGMKNRNVTLIVIGLGRPRPALIPNEELAEEDRRLATEPFYKIDGQNAMTSLDVATLNQLTTAVGDDATFVPVTAAGEFKFKPLVSHMSPKERVGEMEIYFYPCLAFFILICVTPLLTARRARSVRTAREV